jgi:hypothetical protein
MRNEEENGMREKNGRAAPFGGCGATRPEGTVRAEAGGVPYRNRRQLIRFRYTPMSTGHDP